MTDNLTFLTALVKRGQKNLLLVPIAFVNEHIETLHELDIEYAKEIGEEIGAEKIGRCPTPNDHPLFIGKLNKNVFSSQQKALVSIF